MMPPDPRLRALVLCTLLLVTLAMATLGGLGRTSASSMASGITLPPGACPMVHCNPFLDNTEAVTPPTMATVMTTAWTTTPTGVSSQNVGCPGTNTMVVCAMNSAVAGTPRLYAYAPSTGQLLWSSTVPGAGAASSTPLIDAKGNVYISDNTSIYSFSQSGNLNWQTANPLGTPLQSFNTSLGYLVGQGANSADIVAIRPSNGRIVAMLVLSDTVAGQPVYFKQFGNHVSVNGNRLYTVTQATSHAVASQRSTSLVPGRLYAIDFMTTTLNSGSLTVAWHYDQFSGPSGASPMLVPRGASTDIYFDGMTANPFSPSLLDPIFYGVEDTIGSTIPPTLLWAHDFTVADRVPTGSAVTNTATHDPRGGLWTRVQKDSRLFRLDEQTGTDLQVITTTDPGGSRTPYQATGPINVLTVGSTNRPVMLMGIAPLTGAPRPNYVLALDVSIPQGAVLWALNVGVGVGNAESNMVPVAVKPAVPGSHYYAVCSQSDGTIFGLRLDPASQQAVSAARFNQQELDELLSA